MKHQIEQIKLLSDLVWGEEFGRLDWMQSSEEWIDTVHKFHSNILTVTREHMDYLGNYYQKIVGRLILAFPRMELVQNKQVVIKNEWYLSHPNQWQIDGTVCYFSEVIIHPDYRGKDVLKELLGKFITWLNEHQITFFYATGVSPQGCKVIEQFLNAEVLAVKSDDRVVYKVSIEK